MASIGPGASDSKTSSKVFNIDQSNTASDQAINNAQRRSFNNFFRLGRNASYTVNNRYEGLGQDDLKELLQNTNAGTGLQVQIGNKDREKLNAKAAAESLAAFGPKAKVFWIVGALLLVAVVAVGSAFWHHKK